MSKSQKTYKKAHVNRIYNRHEKALLRERIHNITTNLADIDKKLYVNTF